MQHIIYLINAFSILFVFKRGLGKNHFIDFKYRYVYWFDRELVPKTIMFQYCGSDTFTRLR